MAPVITYIAEAIVEYLGVDFAAMDAAELVVEAVLYAAVAYGVYSTMSHGPQNLGQLNNGKLSMFRDATPDRRVCYGIQRLSGPVIFAHSQSKPSSDANEFLNLIIALCEGPIDSINNVYFDSWTAITGSGYNVLNPFAGWVNPVKNIGDTSQSVDFEMKALMPEIWTDNCLLNGIAYLYVRLQYNSSVFTSGLPNINAVVFGKQCVDPRTNSASFTENPAVILLDYLTTMGIPSGSAMATQDSGASAFEINMASFIEAANICDELVLSATSSYSYIQQNISGSYYEPRYVCDYSFLTSDTPETTIENILTSCYGTLTYSSGQFVLRVGAYRAPFITLNEDDLSGNIKVIVNSSLADYFNAVEGTYTSGEDPNTSSFQAADFVEVTSSYYQNTLDHGVQYYLDIQLPATNYMSAARRLAKIQLLDSRNDMVITYPCKLSGLQLVPGDFVYVNNVRFGWTNLLCQVTAMKVSQTTGVELTLKEGSPDVYDWFIDDANIVNYLQNKTNLPTPFTVNPPTGFVATEYTTRTLDGTIVTQVQLNWDDFSDGNIAAIELQYKKASASTWIALGSFSNSAQNFTTITVDAGVPYQFQAALINTAGAVSAWAESDVTPLGILIPPSAPYAITFTGTTLPPALAASWVNNPADTDYAGTRLYLSYTASFVDSPPDPTTESFFVGTINGDLWNHIPNTTDPCFAAPNLPPSSASFPGSYKLALVNINSTGLTSSFSSASVSILTTGSYAPVDPITSIQLYEWSSSQPPNPPNIINPPGWSINIPVAGANEALWTIIGQQQSGSLVAPWSTPARMGGTITWYTATMPTGTGVGVGDIWFDPTDNYKMYRYDGVNWIYINKLVTQPDFGTGILPLAYGLVLPTLPTGSFPSGSLFFDLTDSNLYRTLDGNTWTAAVSGTLITSGSISSDQILANTITAGQIAAGSITATLVGANQIITSDANILSASISDASISSINAGKITAGTITAAVQLNAASLQAGKISVDSAFYNELDPTKTFPPFPVQMGGYGPQAVSHLSPYTKSLMTFSGWSNGASSSYTTTAFGKSSTLFNFNFQAFYSVGDTQNQTLFMYQVNSGSWITPAQIVVGVGNNNFGNGIQTITGLSGYDYVNFGLGYKSIGASDVTLQYSQLIVEAYNI